MKVKAICINDAGRPKEIPIEKWVEKGETYNVKHVYNMVKQEMILGCDLWEINLKGCDPFLCYKLDRFAFSPKDMQKLFELMRACAELNEVSDDAIKELVEELHFEEELV